MAKRRGQWYGDREIKTAQQVPLIADVVQLLPPATALESIRDIVFERCIITFGMTRINATPITDLEWMAWHGRVGDNTLIPLEALNPRSASSTTMAHSSIVQFGQLPVPGIIKSFDSSGVFVNNDTDDSVVVMEVDFDVKRSIQRGNEGIWLTVAAGLDDVVRVNVAWRTYYTYA